MSSVLLAQLLTVAGGGRNVSQLQQVRGLEGDWFRGEREEFVHAQFESFLPLLFERRTKGFFFIQTTMIQVEHWQAQPTLIQRAALDLKNLKSM